MSSHHIVRENQEPALLIEDCTSIDRETLGQLLEWSPRVVIKDTQLEAIQSQGIHIDVVFFYQQTPTLPDLQAGTQVSYYKDDFVSEALEYLSGIQSKEINILASIEGLIPKYFKEPLQISLFQQQKKYYQITSGFWKWLKKDEKIHIPYPLNDLHTKGLIKIDATTFCTQEDGIIALHFDHDSKLIIGEEISC
jgi:thiamine pyrophosphokinase